MIAHNHVRPVRTHRNIRTLRSLMTRVGPAQGNWSRTRAEALAGKQRRGRHTAPVDAASAPAPPTTGVRTAAGISHQGCLLQAKFIRGRDR